MQHCENRNPYSSHVNVLEEIADQLGHLRILHIGFGSMCLWKSWDDLCSIIYVTCEYRVLSTRFEEGTHSGLKRRNGLGQL